MNTTGIVPMKLKTPKYTWKGAALALVYLAAGLALMTLAGCANLLPKIPEAQRAPLKGRAFFIQSVTVSPDVTPQAGEDESEHCLPDSMYAAMLKDQLEIAFKNAQLGEGAGTAVPVRIIVISRKFARGVLENSQIKVNMKIGNDISNNVTAYNGATTGYYDDVEEWKRERRVIPTLALIVTNGVSKIKAGADFSKQQHRGLGIYAFDYWSGEASNDGLHQPLTVADIERATGKSATELAAICKANEDAAK